MNTIDPRIFPSITPMDTQTTPTQEFTPRFKRGDIVRLNSGGPQMTVQEPAGEDDEMAECQWFTGDGSTLLTETFFEECLTPVVNS